MDVRLPTKYFEPFDIVYRDVTKAILVHLDSPKPGGRAVSKDWLRRLVGTFQIERDAWNGSSSLNGYRFQWRRLHSRMARLAAGAFLHVSYDLPRAMANDWPGERNWPNLSEPQAEAAYQDLTPVFNDSFERATGRLSVVGRYFLVLSPLPAGMRGWFSHWLLLQREAAWRNARLLALQPDRVFREAKLAQAMTDALSTVSDLLVYRSSRLLPPRLYSPATISIAAILLAALEWGPLLLMILLSLGHLAVRRELVELRRSRDLEFVDIFAMLVSEFTNAAVQDPENYEAYAKRRREEILVHNRIVPEGELRRS